MSTSLLYHGFGIRGYEHVRIVFFEGEVIFTIRQKPESLRCPVCGGGNVVGKGRRWRVFKSVPIGSKPVKIVWAVPRVRPAWPGPRTSTSTARAGQRTSTWSTA